MSVEMSSGVLVAEMLEGMKFALGPTMAVRRDCLESAGGFHALGQYHADDLILGTLIAANGCGGVVHACDRSSHPEYVYPRVVAAPDPLDAEHSILPVPRDILEPR